MTRLDQLDILQGIGNPLLRDWSIVFSVAGVGLFFVLRWIVTIITQAKNATNTHKSTEASRLEQYLNNELNLSRQEKRELTTEIQKIGAQISELNASNLRLKLQLKHVVMRTRYLEKLLYENQIQFIPAIENYDDF